MHDLASRDATLEYWFWKLHWPGGGAIVDFIVRHAIDEAELRISTWQDGRVRPVIHHRTADRTASASGIRIDDTMLDANGSHGEIAGVAWALRWELGPARVAPRPDWFGPLHPYDMELVVRPSAAISGTITIEGRTIPIDGPGGVCHYWGRRLPDRWCWISATGFDDDPSGRFEALVAASRLYGVGPAVPVGYTWIQDGEGTDLVVMPLTGVVTVRRGDHAVHLASARVDARRHDISCRAAAADFNDAGEGIAQTMLADLLIDGRLRATGSVGLEFRGSR